MVLSTQLQALLFAVGGGTFMGLYPSFIKTKEVIHADVHPVVFQLYKSSVVFLTGLLTLIPSMLRRDFEDPDRPPLFVWNSWAVVAAAFWVPAGLFTIASVPLIGMSMGVALHCSASAVLSFLVFWLVFNHGTGIKSYPGFPKYRAPCFLALTVAGMITMVFAKEIAAALGGKSSLKKKQSDEDLETEGSPSQDGSASRDYDFLLRKEKVDFSETEETASTKNRKTVSLEIDASSRPLPTPPRVGRNASGFLRGVLLSLMSGVFSATQYGILNPAKASATSDFVCSSGSLDVVPGRPCDCADGTEISGGGRAACLRTRASLDNFGSWAISFGIGALGVALSLYAAVWWCEGRRPPLRWEVLRSAGVWAGVFWSVANLLITEANVLGGNAVVMAQVLSAQIAASGAWGILHYGEGGGPGAVAAWVAAALTTLSAMMLLGFEKEI